VVTSWLDEKHVVFGEVIDGMDIVRQVEGLGTTGGRPKMKISITACGLAQ
jgi:cyclophilin family peptidyl-prolyl cis-trans isomerase